MSDAIGYVRDALATMSAPAFASVEVVRHLGKGPTNELWQIRCDQMDCVLRQVKPFASSVGLALDRELPILRAVADAGIAPPVIAASVEHGFVLTRFVPGRVWEAQDMHQHRQLTRLAKLLRQLHQLKMDATPINLRSVIQEYAKRSTDPEAGTWRKDALAQLDHIRPRATVICHNDLTAANVIDVGGLQLIDWEFAAPGDPFFDLAVVVAHHQLDAPTRAHFLTAYLGREDKTAMADLNRWCAVYRSLRALWESLQDDTRT